MEDLISRQEMMRVYQEVCNHVTCIECSMYQGDGEVCRLEEWIKQLPSAQPEVLACGEGELITQPEGKTGRWIPCSERLPERIINGNVETVQEFFVTVKERWPGEEWSYDTDIAEFPGDYIDDIWQTYNDWREGQEVHVIAWMPLPEPYQEEHND